MAMSLAILGSGSSGNCSLLSLHDGNGESMHVLIDAGLSPRETGRRLGAFGVGVADITDILITHFDGDHFNPGWPARLATTPVRVHAHRRHRNPAGRARIPRGLLTLHDGDITFGPASTRIETMLLAHDAHGTVGFVIEHGGARLGYATDLGRVPLSLYERFTGLDALALESNYDVQMQQQSARPAFLRRRIMGGTGHLSNDQALDAVLRIADASKLQHVALLHLSRQCNCPRLVQSLYARQASHLLDRLTITSQHRPTTPLHIAPRRNGSRSEPLGRPGAQHVLF